MTNTSESDQAARVRQAFFDQSGYCDRLGSPFTALLCRVLGRGLDPAKPLERFILEWPGDPSAFADSVPLRIAGALHYLVRARRSPDLALLYPPHSKPDPEALLAAVRVALVEDEPFVRDFLQFPPQTNEVGRSAALIAGWLEIADATRLPLSLFEIGSSAGLNLIADRYVYQFGDGIWTPHRTPSGRPQILRAPTTIVCDWTGRRPAIEAPLRVQSRRGCDRHPLDTVDPEQRERLMAYIWPDQAQRMARLDAAIDAMRANPVYVERADAAEWIRSVLPAMGEVGIARVVFHSIVWSYLDASSQQLIATHLAEIGAKASDGCPLAWLRMELGGKSQPAELRLTLWPGGEERFLAHVHPHGQWVNWAS